MKLKATDIAIGDRFQYNGVAAFCVEVLRVNPFRNQVLAKPVKFPDCPPEWVAIENLHSRWTD